MNATLIFDMLASPAILTPVGLAIGVWLKKMPWWNTRGIPVVTILSAVLVRILDKTTGGVVAPSVASLFGLNTGTLVTAGFMDNWIVGCLFAGITQGALTTGVHGAWKNILQFIANGPTLLVPAGDPRGRK